MSKSFSAALRVGYLIAPAGRLAEVRQASRHNSFGISRPIAAVAAEVLASPDWGKMRDAVDAAYTQRMTMLAEALSGFNLAWRAGVPFAFLQLPRGWRVSGFARAAEERGVLVRPADDFVLIDGRAPNAVRLAIDARVPLEVFRKGVEVLRGLLTEAPHEMDV
jgi:DNA-binding transcriptional MocR family regulator